MLLNRQLKTRRIFHQAQEDPSGGLCYHQHTTAQHNIDENCNVFYGIYGWEVNWKTVTHMSKKMTDEKMKIAFISCHMNTEKRHMLTLALIGRRSLDYRKEGLELNGHLNRRNQIPCSLLHLKESGVLPLDKLWKWTMTICEKSLQWQASWQTKPRQEGSSTIRKQQSRWMA